MIISTTEDDIYAHCPWKWDKMSFNREGLTAIIKKPYLDLGSLCHKTLYAWIEEPDAHPADLFDVFAKEHLLYVAETYKAVIGTGISKVELASLDEIIRVGRAMMENYHAMYGTPLPPGWTLVSGEQTCLVRIPGTRHKPTCMIDEVDVYEPICKCVKCVNTCHQTPYACYSVSCDCCCWHQLEGTLDGLIADERGTPWVMENKTWDKHPDKNRLKWTSQFAKYIWLAQQLGLQPGGIAYNGMWTRAVVPNGRWKFEDLFMRELLPINQDYVDKIGFELPWRANDMADHVAGKPFWKNRGFTCGGCGVFSLCQADDYNEDYEYVLQTEYIKRPLTPAYEAVQADTTN